MLRSFKYNCNLPQPLPTLLRPILPHCDYCDYCDLLRPLRLSRSRNQPLRGAGDIATHCDPAICFIAVTVAKGGNLVAVATLSPDVVNALGTSQGFSNEVILPCSATATSATATSRNLLTTCTLTFPCKMKP